MRHIPFIYNWDSLYPGERTLDDFADHIITRNTKRGNAVLDTGFKSQVSDPDFAPNGYGPTPADACVNCATAIRANAKGTKPRSCIKPDGYDLRYRLMRVWVRKEQMEALGLDPNALIVEINDGDYWRAWPVAGEWLARSAAVKHLEFFYRLLFAAQHERLAQGIVTKDIAQEEVVQQILEEIKDSYGIGCTPELMEILRDRVSVDFP